MLTVQAVELLVPALLSAGEVRTCRKNARSSAAAAAAAASSARRCVKRCRPLCRPPTSNLQYKRGAKATGQQEPAQKKGGGGRRPPKHGVHSAASNHMPRAARAGAAAHTSPCCRRRQLASKWLARCGAGERGQRSLRKSQRRRAAGKGLWRHDRASPRAGRPRQTRGRPCANMFLPPLLVAQALARTAPRVT